MSVPGQTASGTGESLSITSHSAAFAVVLMVLISLTQPAVAQTYSLLYQFKAGRDGSNPYASMVLDGKGNLYGTTTIDGAYGYGTVFEVTPTGKERVIYSFTGTGGDGATPFGPLMRDSAGNLYGTTYQGGTFGGACGGTGCGVVFRVDSTGKETVLYRFSGTPNDGQNPNQGLVRDASGSLYGTTFLGGAYGVGTVFKIDPTGAETVLHNFGLAGVDGYIPVGGSLVQDFAGNLYGTTAVGGSQGGGTIFKLDHSGNETILFNFNFTDGYEPTGTLLRDQTGNLYGTTWYGGAFNFGTIFKIDTSNNQTVLYSFSAANGDGAVPSGSLIYNDGYLYGTTNAGGSSYAGTIFKLDLFGTETILHSFSNTDGRDPDLGLVRDSKGNLYGTAQYGGAYGGGVVFKLVP